MRKFIDDFKSKEEAEIRIKQHENYGAQNVHKQLKFRLKRGFFYRVNASYKDMPDKI